MAAAASGGPGSPCGACKFLRRRCSEDCVFAPYFGFEQGADRFAAIHRVFGASNASKMLMHVPLHERCDAVLSIAYEAQARLHDPVYGCVAHIIALQRQLASLQAQLMQAKARLAQSMVGGSGRSSSDQWQGTIGNPLLHAYHEHIMQSMSPPQSSLEYIYCSSEAGPMQEIAAGMEGLSTTASETRTKVRTLQGEEGDLHALALRMMKN